MIGLFIPGIGPFLGGIIGGTYFYKKKLSRKFMFTDLALTRKIKFRNL